MARQRNQVIIRASHRRQQSKWKREQGKQRAAIIAGIIAVLFILAIPAYGYWANFIAPPKSVVLQIDNTKYNLGFITKYIQGLQALGQQPNLSVDPFQFMQLLQENEFVRSGATSRGITLDPAELDQELRNRIMGIPSEATDTPEEQLEREFKDTYIRYLDTINLSEEEHRNLIEASLLRVKLKDALSEEVPTIAKQAKISWIVIVSDAADEDIAAASAERIFEVTNGLSQGVDFAILAEEFSDDRETAVNGGEYGWVPEGVFGILDDTIFTLQLGEISDPVYVEDFTYFIQLHEIDEERVIEPDMKNIMQEGVLQQWLAEERGNHRITSCFGGGSAGGACDWQYDWLVKKVTESAVE